MFRQFARLPFGRNLHSQASASSGSFARYTRSVYALGASVTIAGYLAWSWSTNGRHISLDSEPVPAPKKYSTSPKHVSAPRPYDEPTRSAPQNDAPESSTLPPDSTEPHPAPSETTTEGEGAQGESSGGAFNPETGEINWDCPCLGGMAHGPCGPQFREAFSCFVHSDADPKGVDCVEKFKAMQDCFRQHPDVYGDEIMDEDEDEPPVGSTTTDETKGDLHLTDSLPLETTEQLSIPAPS